MYGSSPDAQPADQTRIGGSSPARSRMRGITLSRDVLPRLRVAEEAGDVDQDRVEELRELVRVRLEALAVLGVVLRRRPRPCASGSAASGSAACTPCSRSRARRGRTRAAPRSSGRAPAFTVVMPARARSGDQLGAIASRPARCRRRRSRSRPRHAEVPVVASSWASTVPPAALTASTPAAPSTPVPVRMTATVAGP